MQTYSVQQFADLLRTTKFSDGVARRMARDGDGTISVNVTDLTAQERGLARAALTELGEMTGLRFVETTGRARITYVNDGDGATTTTWSSGTTITSATVRIASSRVDPGDGYGSFAFRTYMHETAHALGLGHPQDYDRVQSFSQSVLANDSWQMSVMSYFDQVENTAIHATKAYHLTPMIADHVALRDMYGALAMHEGHTVYGVNSNAGGALDAAARLGARVTFLIADHGGVDLADFSAFAAGQRIDLRPGAISDVMGAVGNMRIAFDTLIEHATGGSGNDRITGNAAANRLAGGSGHDTLDGGLGPDALSAGAGRDRVLGGAGSDSLNAGDGDDLAEGAEGGDRLFGLDGHDTLNGGAGHDILLGGAGDDMLRGGAGDDDLAAGAGTDGLDGGGGDDLLRGGAGRDHFVFAEGADRIRGFGDGTDVIDLRGVAGLDRWSDVAARLSPSGDHVLFRQGDHSLTIEWTRVQDLDAGDFLW